MWSKSQSKQPANIFNFSIIYQNNTLATRKNLHLWAPRETSDRSFWLQPESLPHIAAGCKTYLDQWHYTWRHNSALCFIAQTLQSIKSAKLYADLHGYISRSTITGERLRPDNREITHPYDTANGIPMIHESTKRPLSENMRPATCNRRITGLRSSCTWREGK